MTDHGVTGRQLAQRNAARGGVDPDVAERLLGEMLRDMADVLAAGGRVTLRGFGVFHAPVSPAAARRRPDTGESVDVPERRLVHFRPSRTLRTRVNS